MPWSPGAGPQPPPVPRELRPSSSGYLDPDDGERFKNGTWKTSLSSTSQNSYSAAGNLQHLYSNAVTSADTHGNVIDVRSRSGDARRDASATSAHRRCSSSNPPAYIARPPGFANEAYSFQLPRQPDLLGASGLLAYRAAQQQGNVTANPSLLPSAEVPAPLAVACQPISPASNDGARASAPALGNDQYRLQEQIVALQRQYSSLEHQRLAAAASNSDADYRGSTTGNLSRRNSNGLVGFEDKPLDKEFYRRDAEFFCFGRVFAMLWHETLGDTIASTVQKEVISSRHGEKAFAKVRRFVVIREGNVYCGVLAIATYGQNGVTKPHLLKQEHGIIYSGGREPPEPLPGEVAGPGKVGMQPRAIRVDSARPDLKLDPLSRLHYGKVHTVEHNVKVKDLGRVNLNSTGYLLSQFRSVFEQSLVTNRQGYDIALNQQQTPPSSLSASSRGRQRRRSSGAAHSYGSRGSQASSSALASLDEEV